MGKMVYSFGNGTADGNSLMRELLGGKGANLAEMSRLGLPVPPGFTIPTEICHHFYKHQRTYPEGLKEEVEKALENVGQAVQRRFGGTPPLLVSIRSGARSSMPGMMDTILNLGLNDENRNVLGKLSGNDRFALDTYRRFIQMYSQVVLYIPGHLFEDALERQKEKKNHLLDSDLQAEELSELIETYKHIVQTHSGKAFPQDPFEQLWQAISAVFDSWGSARAITYRRLNNIPENWGTAVTIQAMVFGNMGMDSATGVAFTRNPSTGAKEFYGEFLLNSQGEDVVAGIRTPYPLTEIARRSAHSEQPSLEGLMPEVFAQFLDMTERLERHYGDMQDIEFTIEQGKLFLLQARSGKRTAKAALRICVEMAQAQVISQEEAVMRLNPTSLAQLLHPTLHPTASRSILAKGLPASPGAASGEIVFHPDEAESLKAKGRRVILVRRETSPEDIHGMHAAEGILTTRGGMTSHAAVVARGMGKPCICGAHALHIDYEAGFLQIGTRILKKGTFLTLDGTTGEILEGEVQMIQPEMSQEFLTLMEWADTMRRMKVRANAETPEDAEMARQFGAEGIGLCRTEHMFFEKDRILAMREMILAKDLSGRQRALAKLLPMQRQDFSELFSIMAGLPVTIRLLDPPLHEFLPHQEAEIKEIAQSISVPIEQLQKRAAELHEVNPMLGFRGVRLAVCYPEIAEMQTRAIFEGAHDAYKKTGTPVQVEIMIPLVLDRRELDLMGQIIHAVAQRVFTEKGQSIPYTIGTMIELPRAALTADKIALSADFFSFGTNDLTQTTLGMSRDDSVSFLNHYIDKNIFKTDPFTSIDEEGVGELIRLAVHKGRQAKPKLKVGVCGEHGGDPTSISFCEQVGLDYISCSPFRLAIARLAAAQAALKGRPRPIEMRNSSPAS